jgi:hypothetical protein
MSPLEHRYRRLMRAYPKQYRSARADEMLGTLLDTAAPGQRHPTARESAALILGGIRARSATNANMPAPASFRLAAMLACSTYVGIWTAMQTRQLIAVGPDAPWPHATTTRAAITWVALVGATIAVWFVRREIAVPVLVGALTAALFWNLAGPPLTVCMLLLALLTAARTEQLPKAWLWWSCVPVAFIAGLRAGDSAGLHRVRRSGAWRRLSPHRQDSPYLPRDQRGGSAAAAGADRTAPSQGGDLTGPVSRRRPGWRR